MSTVERSDTLLEKKIQGRLINVFLNCAWWGVTKDHAKASFDKSLEQLNVDQLILNEICYEVAVEFDLDGVECFVTLESTLREICLKIMELKYG